MQLLMIIAALLLFHITVCNIGIAIFPNQTQEWINSNPSLICSLCSVNEYMILGRARQQLVSHCQFIKFHLPFISSAVYFCLIYKTAVIFQIIKKYIILLHPLIYGHIFYKHFVHQSVSQAKKAELKKYRNVYLSADI